MSWAVFLDLVEIRTKLASLFPFLVGTLFSIYYFSAFDAVNTGLFFIAMLAFDMATTAINNFMDFIKAKDRDYLHHENVVGRAKLSKKLVISIIVGLITFSAVISLVLVARTNLLLLFMGGACFFIGIFYTFGPVPLSRMPLGEIFSGMTMGFGIFFIAIYVNAYDQNIVNLVFSGRPFVGLATEFGLVGNWLTLVRIGVVSLPTVFTIANIMLANNLCDLETDIKNHRYTLPFYIGRQRAVLLFDFLMYSCYVVIIAGVLLRLYHPVMLLVLLTFPLIKKQVAAFNQKQVKSETFAVSIKNLTIFNSAQVLALLVSIILK